MFMYLDEDRISQNSQQRIKKNREKENMQKKQNKII